MNRVDPSWGVHASATPALSCRLRLTHSRGRARDGLVEVDAQGLPLGAALRQIGVPIDGEQAQSADLCRIHWVSAGQAWMLVNGSPSLTCVVGGQRVPCGETVQLAHDDEVELGLHRFVLELHGLSDTQAAGRDGDARNGEAASATRIDEAATSADVDLAFDLRSLALPAPEGAGAGPAIDDPFQVLDIDGASVAPVQDPLAPWLGDAPVRSDAAVKAQALDGLSPQGDRTPSAGASSGLLHDLHEEFVRVVRDPSQLHGRADWEGPGTSIAEPAPSLDQLSEAAQPYALLRDILMPREEIDRVIDDFDPLGRSAVFDEPQVDDVLRLFAPELARHARAAVPGLTQQEHHQLAPDSHMHVGSLDRRARPADAADDPGAPA